MQHFIFGVSCHVGEHLLSHIRELLQSLNLPLTLITFDEETGLSGQERTVKDLQVSAVSSHRIHALNHVLCLFVLNSD